MTFHIRPLERLIGAIVIRALDFTTIMYCLSFNPIVDKTINVLQVFNVGRMES